MRFYILRRFDAFLLLKLMKVQYKKKKINM